MVKCLFEKWVGWVVQKHRLKRLSLPGRTARREDGPRRRDKLSKKLIAEEFIRKAKKVHANKYDYSKTNYMGRRNKILITCPIHGDFLQLAGNHLEGRGCQKCGNDTIGNKNRVPFNKFIEKCKKIHSNKYNYSKVIYKTNDTKIVIICPIHGEFKQLPMNHVKGAECKKCSLVEAAKKRTKSNSFFIQKSIEIHSDKYDYSKAVYERCNKKVVIVCKKHGEFLQRPSDHLHGTGCPICKLSKGENKIRNWLVKHRIKFISQYKFKGCKNINILLFDFYIPKYKLLIEYDGRQHFRNMSFGDSGLKNTKKCDNIKTKWAKKNGYKLLRIKYTKFKKIPEILEKELKIN
jgi:very-short-patch-repair endonuclease